MEKLKRAAPSRRHGALVCPWCNPNDFLKILKDTLSLLFFYTVRYLLEISETFQSIDIE